MSQKWKTWGKAAACTALFAGACGVVFWQISKDSQRKEDLAAMCEADKAYLTWLASEEKGGATQPSVLGEVAWIFWDQLVKGPAVEMTWTGLWLPFGTDLRVGESAGEPIRATYTNLLGQVIPGTYGAEFRKTLARDATNLFAPSERRTSAVVPKSLGNHMYRMVDGVRRPVGEMTFLFVSHYEFAAEGTDGRFWDCVQAEEIPAKMTGARIEVIVKRPNGWKRRLRHELEDVDRKADGPVLRSFASADRLASD